MTIFYMLLPFEFYFGFTISWLISFELKLFLHIKQLSISYDDHITSLALV